MTDLLTRRSLGAYFTPRGASTWLAQWLLSDGVDTILEPSSGDGSFVRAVNEVAEARGLSTLVHAVEIDPASLALLERDERVQPTNSDFHEVNPFVVDAAIGNPPFVRFRHLTQSAARAAFETGTRALDGKPIDPSGSTWMTFVLHASTFLRSGGRMAFVLPADALYVRYGRVFWECMASRFGELRVIRCRQRVFPDLLQDVLLLLADHSGSSTATIHSEIYATLDDLMASRCEEKMGVSIDEVITGCKPFAKALLGQLHEHALEKFEATTVRADTYVKFNIGYVSGHKTFFHPSSEERKHYRLPERSLLHTAKSGREMTGSGLRTSSLSHGAISRLWFPDAERLTEGEREYIASGEKADVHTRYKTRIRKPWFKVPGVKVPDLVLSVFGALPKLMLNDGGLVASNSLVTGFWKVPVDGERFALAWYSSITRLGIELSVHSLGGGVLVVIPGEADAIRMPMIPERPAPKSLLAELESALLASDLNRAYRVGDAYLETNGWRRKDLNKASEMADALLSWRVDR